MTRKILNFISTSLLGGLVVILPMVIIYQVFAWLLRWILEAFSPVTLFTSTVFNSSIVPPALLGMLAIVLLCFLVGLLVRTTVGKWLHRNSERWLLDHIPGYEMLKNLFAQLQPDQKRSFSRPVLVTLNSNSVRVYGFITDQHDGDLYTVFIPTSPSPLNGYVIQVSIEQLEFLESSAETVMQSVIGCGIGSQEIMQSISTKKTVA